MNKIINILLAVIMVITLATTCFANYTSDFVWKYEDDNTTVIFEEQTAYSEIKQQYIADMLVYGYSDITLAQPRAWCWLTGHELTTEYVTVITHKVYSTAPRCVKELYEVTTCANCDHETMTMVSTSDISCCPVE